MFFYDRIEKGPFFLQLFLDVSSYTIHLLYVILNSRILDVRPVVWSAMIMPLLLEALSLLASSHRT